MKNFFKTWLLLTVLCIAGCSGEDDPQSVSILTEDAAVTAEGGSLTLSIEANCPWTVSEQSDLVTVTQATGSGNASVKVQIARNAAYDGVTHTIAVTSEDGTSTDRFTVTQEQSYAVQAGSHDMLDCGGGTFSVPVSTNDNISKVEVPDWITFIESRALTGYTYTFTAESNRTGAVRQAAVRIVGARSDGEFTVKQDSYAPASAEAEIPAIVEMAQLPVTASVGISPEYADWSKLTAEADGCTATIADRMLTVNAASAGTFTVRLLSGGSELLSSELTVVDSFDADSVAISLPDSLAMSDEPYTFGVTLIPGYADGNRISAKASGAEVSFMDGILSVTARQEGTCRISILSSDKEIYSKDITVYDASYPLSVELEAPDVICTGRSAYRIRVYPETSDVSKLVVRGSSSTEKFTLEGDSVVANIAEKHFTPVLFVYSNGRQVLRKEFSVVTRSAAFSIDKSTDLVLGEDIELTPIIPWEYASVTVSDESVLKKKYTGIYTFVGEGSSDITLKNKLSGETQTISVECSKYRLQVTSARATQEFIDWSLKFKVAFKCCSVGPGTLYLVHDVMGGNVLTVKTFEKESRADTMFEYEVSDYIILSGIFPADYLTRPKKYKLIYEGTMHGEETRIETDWETIL